MSSNPAADRLEHELAEPLAHPDLAALRQFGEQSLDWLLRHEDTLREQPIGHTASRPQLEALLREPPPETGQDFGRVLAEFEEKVLGYAFRPSHPRFLAFVPSSPTFLSVLGDFLCAGTNFFAGVWLEAAGPTMVELVVLDWFKEFLGYPAEALGILTGGGSEANLTALLVAREPLGYDDRSRAVLYLTEQRHWSVDRAAMVIGMRPDQMHPVPDDAEFHMQPARLREAVRRDRAEGKLPWAVVANAGATNTGVVDPLAELANVCRDEGLWLHVDAAYGWPAVLVPREKTRFSGIGRADSITIDPHKWFGQTFEAGCVLVREGDRLPRTFAMRPDYMQDVAPGSDEVNFADCGIALTRRFRALKIWLSVKVLGARWFRDLADRCCRLAELGEMLLRQSTRFEILCPRRLSVVCFRYVPPGDWTDEDLDRLNLAVVEGLGRTGKAFISSTRLRGRVALRLCFVSWRTTSGDVRKVVELLETVGAAEAKAGR
jgi:glutamate/tyrosine decarboxylase-like PLP-dependent enzyme